MNRVSTASQESSNCPWVFTWMATVSLHVNMPSKHSYTCNHWLKCSTSQQPTFSWGDQKEGIRKQGEQHKNATLVICTISTDSTVSSPPPPPLPSAWGPVPCRVILLQLDLKLLLTKEPLAYKGIWGHFPNISQNFWSIKRLKCIIIECTDQMEISCNKWRTFQRFFFRLLFPFQSVRGDITIPFAQNFHFSFCCLLGTSLCHHVHFLIYKLYMYNVPMSLQAWYKGKKKAGNIP